MKGVSRKYRSRVFSCGDGIGAGQVNRVVRWCWSILHTLLVIRSNLELQSMVRRLPQILHRDTVSFWAVALDRRVDTVIFFDPLCLPKRKKAWIEARQANNLLAQSLPTARVHLISPCSLFYDFGLLPGSYSEWGMGESHYAFLRKCFEPRDSS